MKPLPWIVITRSDWNEGVCTKRYVVGRDGELRGICECWEEVEAQMIAAALNNQQPTTINSEEATNG